MSLHLTMKSNNFSKWTLNGRKGCNKIQKMQKQYFTLTKQRGRKYESYFVAHGARPGALSLTQQSHGAGSDKK